MPSRFWAANSNSAFGLRHGFSVAAGLPTFAYEAETNTLAAAMTVAPTVRRQKSMNWAIKTLKDAGVWSKLLGLWKVGNDEQHSSLNWKTPGTFDLTKTGTPTFVANVGYTGTTGNRLSTGINLTAITPATCYIGFFSNTAPASGASDVGAIDAAGAGLTLNSRNTSNFSGGRIGGANVANLDSTGAWTGDGWTGGGRVDASNVTVYKGPVKKAVTANATATLGSAVITFLGANNNGTFGVSSRQQGGWVIAHGLTEADQKVLANVMNQLQREFTHGGLDTYEAGYAPTTAAYDVIVYGSTSGGVAAAYEASRQGLSVAIVGGWRDRHVGGMSTSGLGYTDFDSQAALTGLPRWMLAQVQTLMGTASNVFAFDPQMMGAVMRRMLDPSKADGLDIPIYWSNGVASVAKTGTVINTLTTADGRTLTANIGFIDASYEGDLAAVAGCTMTVGREAVGTGSEDASGFRGTNTASQGTDPQFKNAAAALVNVDPWITPGNTGSGMLPGLEGIMGTDSPAVGAADARVQAYNFRITQAITVGWRSPFSTSAPPGYSAARYEALGRLLAIDATLAFADLFKQDACVAGVFNDVNYRNGLSIDLIGGSVDYPTATYAQREVIWKAHENYIRGLIYYLQYEADARIPAGVRTTALTFSLSMQHYTRPHPNDDYNWMPQLYVREARRLVGDYIHDGNDIAATDGTTPRSVKTVAVASYTMDSHAVSQWAHNNAGTWRIWNEGGFGRGGGGVNATAPLPIEVVLPKAAEIINLAVIFAVSSTHAAFGSIRMEFSHMLLGQAAAIMLKERQSQGVGLQSLTYSAVRTRLLAANTLSGETQLTLPQVN